MEQRRTAAFVAGLKIGAGSDRPAGNIGVAAVGRSDDPCAVGTLNP
jgi:hypothetical protein